MGSATVPVAVFGVFAEYTFVTSSLAVQLPQSLPTEASMRRSKAQSKLVKGFENNFFMNHEAFANALGQRGRLFANSRTRFRQFPHINFNGHSPAFPLTSCSLL